MKKILLTIKILIFILFISIIIVSSIYVYAYITPKIQINSNDSIIFYDKNGENIFKENYSNDYVQLDKISDNVKNAIISIEDKNFYKHNGFDILRIFKAMLINLKSGEIRQGASTISQQYIKNLYLTFDKTWKRKIEEAYLTIELETHYTKDEILEGYLNTIDFGAGNYGILEASHYYFNKEPIDLTLEEATILVGIPKSPAYYNPISNYNNSKKRQKDVLNTMYKNKYITKNQIDDIYNKELSFYAKKDNVELSSVYYYKDAVLNEMSNINGLPKSLIDIDEIKIYTNYDINVQKELENNINNEMNDTTLQVASIIVEPNTGKIISLIGGKNYNNTQFNRAVSSKRQVGSTIKPFIYYNALENGFTAASTFLSEKTTFNLGEETYSPKNVNNVYANKEITMLSAIAYSDNIYALKTHLFLGTELLSKIMKRIKVETEVKNVASSALGTSEINMIDYANGYITLANEGKHETPHLIEKITDKKGNILYEYKYKNEYLLNKNYVFILNNLLNETYDYRMTGYTSPTLLSVKNDIKGKYSVKSGSTATDYWTIGYNKDYLMLVWAGNDDNSNVLSKDARIAKKIWSKTMSSINDENNTWYETPKNVTISTIDKYTGKISENGIPCYFIKGTEPNYESIEFIESIAN